MTKASNQLLPLSKSSAWLLYKSLWHISKDFYNSLILYGGYSLFLEDLKNFNNDRRAIKRIFCSLPKYPLPLVTFSASEKRFFSWELISTVFWILLAFIVLEKKILYAFRRKDLTLDTLIPQKLCHGLSVKDLRKSNTFILLVQSL